jgi:hypothetical protein
VDLQQSDCVLAVQRDVFVISTNLRAYIMVSWWEAAEEGELARVVAVQESFQTLNKVNSAQRPLSCTSHGNFQFVKATHIILPLSCTFDISRYTVDIQGGEMLAE